MRGVFKQTNKQKVGLDSALGECYSLVFCPHTHTQKIDGPPSEVWSPLSLEASQQKVSDTRDVIHEMHDAL